MISRIYSAIRQGHPGFRGALFYFVMYAAIGVFAPFLTVYFAQLGLSGKEIGILSAFFPLMSLISAPGLSRVADQYGIHRLLLAICLVGQALLLAFMQMPISFIGLLPITLAYSLFRSPVQPISDSLIIRMVIRHDLDYGKLRQWGSISYATISLLCGFIWSRLGHQWMFYVAGLASLIGILPAMVLEPHQHEPTRSLHISKALLKDPLLRIIVLATFLTGAALGIGRTFEGVFITHLGGSEQMVGAFIAISAFSEIPSMYYGRRLTKNITETQTLILASALMVGAYLGYSVIQNSVWMLGFAVFKGIGYGFFYITTISLVDKIAPKELKATAQSIVFAAGWGLGPMLAMLAGGMIFDLWGPQIVFRMSALLVLLAILLLSVLHLQEKKEAKYNKN